MTWLQLQPPTFQSTSLLLARSSSNHHRPGSYDRNSLPYSNTSRGLRTWSFLAASAQSVFNTFRWHLHKKQEIFKMVARLRWILHRALDWIFRGFRPTKFSEPAVRVIFSTYVTVVTIFTLALHWIPVVSEPAMRYSAPKFPAITSTPSTKSRTSRVRRRSRATMTSSHARLSRMNRTSAGALILAAAQAQYIARMIFGKKWAAGAWFLKLTRASQSQGDGYSALIASSTCVSYIMFPVRQIFAVGLNREKTLFGPSPRRHAQNADKISSILDQKTATQYGSTRTRSAVRVLGVVPRSRRTWVAHT